MHGSVYILQNVALVEDVHDFIAYGQVLDGAVDLLDHEAVVGLLLAMLVAHAELVNEDHNDGTFEQVHYFRLVTIS